MNINLYMTNCYKQKQHLHRPAKQTQFKPNLTLVFGPKIGFVFSKPAGNFLNKPPGLQPYSRKNSLWLFFSDMVQYRMLIKGVTKMAENHPKSVRKRRFSYLTFLLLFVLLVSLFTAVSSEGPAVIFASENNSEKQKADPNQTPADPNEQQKTKDKKPLRPLHKHPAFTQRVKERIKMVNRQIRSRDVRDPNTLAAMQMVPRHTFVRLWCGRGRRRFDHCGRRGLDGRRRE